MTALGCRCRRTVPPGLWFAEYCSLLDTWNLFSMLAPFLEAIHRILEATEETMMPAGGSDAEHTDVRHAVALICRVAGERGAGLSKKKGDWQGQILKHEYSVLNACTYARSVCFPSYPLPSRMLPCQSVA